jgi:hypothetical protein
MAREITALSDGGRHVVSCSRVFTDLRHVAGGHRVDSIRDMAHAPFPVTHRDSPLPGGDPNAIDYARW